MIDQTMSEKDVSLQGEIITEERATPISQIVTAFQNEAAKVSTSSEGKSLFDGACTTLLSVVAAWGKIAADALARQPNTPPTEIVQDLMTPKREKGEWPPRSEIGGYVEIPVEIVDTRNPYKLKGGDQGYRPPVTEEDWKQTVLFQARQATMTEDILRQLGFLPQESSLEALFNRPIEGLGLFQREFRGHKVSGNIYDLMWEEGEPVKWAQWSVFALKSPTIPEVRAGVSFWHGGTPEKMEVRLGFSFGPGAVTQSISSTPVII